MSDKTEKILMANQETVNPTMVWLLFIFLGWSYGSLRKIGLQILFYLTLGGLGVWMLIRFFTLGSAIRAYNNTVYIRHGLNEMVR